MVKRLHEVVHRNDSDNARPLRGTLSSFCERCKLRFDHHGVQIVRGLLDYGFPNKAGQHFLVRDRAFLSTAYLWTDMFQNLNSCSPRAVMNSSLMNFSCHIDIAFLRQQQFHEQWMSRVCEKISSGIFPTHPPLWPMPVLSAPGRELDNPSLDSDILPIIERIHGSSITIPGICLFQCIEEHLEEFLRASYGNRHKSISLSISERVLNIRYSASDMSVYSLQDAFSTLSCLCPRRLTMTLEVPAGTMAVCRNNALPQFPSI